MLDIGDSADWFSSTFCTSAEVALLKNLSISVTKKNWLLLCGSNAVRVFFGFLAFVQELHLASVHYPHRPNGKNHWVDAK